MWHTSLDVSGRKRPVTVGGEPPDVSLIEAQRRGAIQREVALFSYFVGDDFRAIDSSKRNLIGGDL